MLHRKPIIFDYRWSVLFYVVLMVSISFNSLFILGGTAFIVPSLLILAGVSYFYFFKKGYFVIGANGKDFYEVLVEYLNQRHYSFEQTENAIIIKDPPLEIVISPESLANNGHIKIKSQENVAAFNTIIKELKQKDIKIKLVTPIVYIIMGVSYVCLLVFLAYNRIY